MTGAEPGASRDVPTAVGAASRDPVSGLPAARDGAAGRRARKFRQAAFFYLHVGLLYEFTVVALARSGGLPAGRGPAWLWLAVGAVIVAAVFWALWFRHSVWTARAIWALHALRLPALIEGAFFPAAATQLPSSFYLTALVVVVANLWMLARAGWDL